MPIVFVHGVGTRRTDPTYDGAVADRDELFKTVFLPNAGLPDTNPFNAYWGDDGVTFSCGLTCVPSRHDDLVHLGPFGDTPTAALAAAAVAAAPAGTPRDGLLLAVARQNFAEAVDLLYLTAAQEDLAGQPQLAALARPLAEYLRKHEDQPPDWLRRVGMDNDQDFVRALEADLSPPPSPPAKQTVQLGTGRAIGAAWTQVRDGVAHLSYEARAFVGKPVWNGLRSMLVPQVPIFLGDVFVYLTRRGHNRAPGAIADRVIDELDEAAKQSRETNEPLIVIGHSLGGVIAYDVLSAFRPEIDVDVFCSVGSQVGLFEEMKVTAAGKLAAAGRVPAKPGNIAHWINVVDYNDILSYKVQPVFADTTGINDYPFKSGSLLGAHGAYFGRLSFHQRLGTEVKKVLAS